MANNILHGLLIVGLWWGVLYQLWQWTFWEVITVQQSGSRSWPGLHEFGGSVRIYTGSRADDSVVQFEDHSEKFEAMAWVHPRRDKGRVRPSSSWGWFFYVLIRGFLFVFNLLAAVGITSILFE